jgi:dTDP-4-dehydrorhamnose reductase
MKVVVTGAGGLLGRALVPALDRAEHEPVPLDRRALDITDRSAVAKALRSSSPDAVVNCAAWTDVDGAEDREAEARHVNAVAAATLAAAAAGVGARFVFLSSDYVFDGSKRRPYVESDHPAPLSAYGRSKLEGERAVSAAGGPTLIVRTSWLYGAGGPNFVEAMIRLGEDRDEVHVVADQVGSPTYASELARALVTALERGMTGVAHLAGAGQCSRHELAREVGARLSLPTSFLPMTSDHSGRRAERPACSVLASERPDAIRLRHWREGVSSYLAEREELLGRPQA